MRNYYHNHYYFPYYYSKYYGYYFIFIILFIYYLICSIINIGIFFIYVIFPMISCIIGGIIYIFGMYNIMYKLLKIIFKKIFGEYKKKIIEENITIPRKITENGTILYNVKETKKRTILVEKKINKFLSFCITLISFIYIYYCITPFINCMIFEFKKEAEQSMKNTDDALLKFIGEL